MSAPERKLYEMVDELQAAIFESIDENGELIADEAMEKANRREGEFIAMIEKKQARLAREAAEATICSEKN